MLKKISLKSRLLALQSLFITDLFANTCCHIELILDSFTLFWMLQNWSLTLRILQKAGEYHWFDPLGPSGHWPVCFSWFCCHVNGARAESTQVLWICRCKGRPRWSHDVTRRSPRGMLHMEGREQFICTNIYMSAPGLSVCCPLVSFWTNYERLRRLLMPVILTPDECFDVGKIECNCRDK